MEKNNEIDSFVIYGERNSGTNWLETILTGKSYHLSHPSRAFEIPVLNTSYPSVYENPYGSKHFFGHFGNNDEEISKADRVAFIGIVRNPYDWIAALHKSGHHIPPENCELHNFLHNEWYSMEFSTGKEIMHDRDWESNARYPNIFAMRSKKMRYLILDMPKLAKNYEMIKYEDLCKNPLQILESISKKYKLKIDKNFQPSITKKSYQILDEIKKTIDDNVDWSVENLVGYECRP